MTTRSYDGQGRLATITGDYHATSGINAGTSPMIASAAMSSSSVSVIGNALRLRRLAI